VAGESDHSGELAEAIRAATTPLHLVGGGTKRFFGRQVDGNELSVSAHRGIVSYEPTELVITARAGTPLTDIESALARNNQILGFEPPRFGDGATLGGTLACGLSGPRRPYAGSARDFVLGVRIVNGKGERLAFGGQVMKNVAGYDVSRLMVGALGTLGLLLEASLKVLPRPERELTLGFTVPASEALARISAWSGKPVPLSAACHVDDTLYTRLSGSESAVAAARAKIGGEEVPGGTELWSDLREHRLPFFRDDRPLWRVSLPPAAHVPVAGEWLIDWGGAQRWLKSTLPPTDIWRAAEHAGGHATLFRGGDRAGEVFHPLSPTLAQLHKNLKRAFDPAGLLNPGRYTTAW
jgi:glycolate oxidase FAD binding subunit